MVNKQRKSAGQTAKKRKGFTLVELVIVIAVIAVLAAVLIPTFSNVIENAKRSRDEANLKTLTTEYIVSATMDQVGYSAQETRALALQSAAHKQLESKGTSIWFNQETNEFLLRETEAMLKPNTETAALDSIIAYADEAQNFDTTIYSFAADPKFIYIAGDSDLDKVADTIENLTAYARINAMNDAAQGDITAKIIAEMSELYQVLKNDYTSKGAGVTTVINSFDPAKTLYFDNIGIYGTNPSGEFPYENYVVTNGTTKISGSSKEYKVKEDLTIAFPIYCTLNSKSGDGLVSANVAASVKITVPSKNSASTAVVKQAVQSMLNYSGDSEQSKVVDIINELYDNIGSAGGGDLTNDDLANIEAVVSKVESAVKNQVSTVPTSNKVSISTNVTNKVQYATLAFNYGYIQSEIRAKDGSYTVYYRTTNAVGEGTDVVIPGYSASTSGQGVIKVDSMTANASMTTDSAWSTKYGTEADPLPGDINVLSEYLIPTLNVADMKEIDGIVSLGEDDVVRLYYNNYSDYGIVEGVCVINPKDGTPISYTISPAMYIKRAVLTYVPYDSILGLTEGYIFTLPDTSKSVNLSNMTAWVRLEDGTEKQLTKLTGYGSFYEGKYWLKDVKNTVETITEIFVKDNNDTIVFRQFVTPKEI